MSGRITSNSGSGDIVSNSIVSYSYSEDVTSINPAKLDGGVSQFTLTAIEREEDIDGEYLPNSKLMINNTITFHDDDHGPISFQVKNVSTSGGAVTLVGDTVMGRLNVEKTALPFYYIAGDSVFTGTLAGAIRYYCGLCGVSPELIGLGSLADDIDVNFMGWTGNVWEHLKMLCSGVSLLPDDNMSMEMHITYDTIFFQIANQATSDGSSDVVDRHTINLSQSVDAFEAAKTIEVYNYNTSVGVDRIVYEISNYAEDADPNTTFLASIADSMQVEAGQTITKTFEIDASLTSVNQPVCVSTIDPYPYTGTTGQYVIVGNDDLPVSPAQWVDLGGGITVAISDTPNSIDVTITTPPDDGILLADGSKVSYGPYRIGVESSGDGVEYPAFFVTGTGVFYNKVKHILQTGSDGTITTKDVAQVVDNMFISNLHNLVNRGIIAAQEACGPNVSINLELATPYSGLGYDSTGLGLVWRFGDLPGSKIVKNTNVFRINSVSYNNSTISATASSVTRFDEFNNNWTGGTFSDFDAIALPGVDELAFNEFSVVPLIKE